MALIETGLFDAHGFTDLHVAGHPEGNRDIDPDGGTANVSAALAWKDAFQSRTDARMAIATQFAFDAEPIVAWAEGLRAAGITLPVHVGVAGPAKLQTMIKFAMACGVGQSLRVLQRRAADLTKLMLPFEPTEVLTALARHKAAHPEFRDRARAPLPARRDRGRHRLRRRGARAARQGAGMTRALLFDLDGTLVDTDHLHHAAFAAILAERGEALSIEDYRTHVMGHPNAAVMERFFPGETPSHAAIADRKEAAFRASLADSVAPLAGALALLDWADAEGVGCAVVTNAPRANAEAMLAAAGLAGRFATLVIGDEIARSKPDPLPYREAMRRLGATPSRSVAFEDSRSGLRAARAAGAHVFGMATGLAPAELMMAGAHQVIADFTVPPSGRTSQP